MSITQGEITIVSESTNQIVVGINSYDPNSPRHDIWRMEGTQGVPRDGGVRVAKDIDPTQNFVDNTVEPDRDYRYQLSSHGIPYGQPQGHPSGVNILLDTDIMSDCDDAGAFYLLMNLNKRDECGISCVVTNARSDYSPGVVEAMLLYNGYDINNIPIGAYKDNTVGRTEPFKGTHYPDINADTATYGHTRTTRSQFPDAVNVLRQTLVDLPSNQENVYCSIGFLTNIYYLLSSGPDAISPLTGIELVQQKISHFVIMGGDYPVGNEHNFRSHNAEIYTSDAIDLINNTGLNLYLCGFTLGRDIRAGGTIETDVPAIDPLYICYNEYTEGSFRHYTYDVNAVLSAVRDKFHYFQWTQGWVNVDSEGANTWTNDAEGRHFYAEPHNTGNGPTTAQMETMYDELITEHTL